MPKTLKQARLACLALWLARLSRACVVSARGPLLPLVPNPKAVPPHEFTPDSTPPIAA